MRKGITKGSKNYIKVMAVLLCSSFLLYGCGLFSSDSDSEDQLDTASTANQSIRGTISVPKTNAQPNLSMSVLNMNVSEDLMSLTDATVCIVDILTQSSMSGIECMKTDSNGQFTVPVPSREGVDGQLLMAVKEKTLITAIIDITEGELSITGPVNGDPFTSAMTAKVMEIIAEDESAELLAGETVEFDATKQKEFLASIKELAKEVKKEVEKKSLAEVESVIKLPEAIKLSSSGVFDSVAVMKKRPKLSVEIKSNAITSLKTKMKAKQTLYVSNVKIKKAGGKKETLVDKKQRLAAGAGGATAGGTTITNLAATDITLSNMNIAENEAVGTEIGTITITDDGLGTNMLTLSGTDAGKFTLDGNTLKTAESFDYESFSSYLITLISTDGSLVFSKDFTIVVTDVDESIVIETIYDLWNSGNYMPPYTQGLIINGDLYMAKNPATIIKITPDNVVTELANGFSWTTGIAVNSNNELFISDRNANKIYKVGLDGTKTHYAGTGANADGNGARLNAEIQGPRALTFDNTGNLYVIVHNKIKKITPDTNGANGMVEDFVDIRYAYQIVFDSNSDKLIVRTSRSDSNIDDGGSIYQIDMSGNITLMFPTAVQGGQIPTGEAEGFAIDSTGTMYIADYSNHYVYKLSPTGELTELFGTGAVWSNQNVDTDGIVTDDADTANIREPNGIVIDEVNNILYISGRNGIKKVTL